jgi:aldehyde dehydrogenase (NAD+)
MTQQSHFLNYVAGQWLDSNEKIDVYDPATGEVFATQALVNDAQLEQAVQAAQRCVDSRVLVKERPVVRARWLNRISAEILKRLDSFLELAVKENGKTLNDAREELEEAARYFEYYAGIADKIEGKSIPLGDDYVDFTVHEPFGISLHIVPWNFPVSICARSLAPALAAGNAVIVKSPEVTPLAINLIAQACEAAGLPEGALSIVCGYGATTGAKLVADPTISHIVFANSSHKCNAHLRSLT